MALQLLSIEHRICLLATELQDHILHHVLRPSPRLIRVDKTYQPPSGLHLSRGTRDGFAEIYYSRNVFEISLEISPNEQTIEEADHSLLRWLRSIPARHRAYLQNIRLDFQYSADDLPASCKDGCLATELVDLVSTTLFFFAMAFEDSYQMAHQYARNASMSYIEPDTGGTKWLLAADTLESFSEAKFNDLLWRYRILIQGEQLWDESFAPFKWHADFQRRLSG
ncbi:hypothetical protein Q7P37_008739 [Cladosporium fusiforme]